MSKSALTRVLLLCGGQSTEHEISLESCLSVVNAIDRKLFSPIVCGITREGLWHHYGDTANFALDADDPDKVHLAPGGKECFPRRTADGVALQILDDPQNALPFDIVFPVLHGAFGEDGAIQGFCQMLGVPCVGCDFTSSANCMDKELAKIILDAAGFRTARGITLRRGDEYSLEAVQTALGLPLFVKPAKTGSSIGISKVKRIEDLPAALEFAFRYDDKVLIEEFIEGREIECAVLEKPTGEIFAAPPGEVCAKDEFYSYAAKYLMPDGAAVSPVAPLQEDEIEQVRRLAAKAFRALGCGGMARVDFFLSVKHGWVLNELNTIPGFTKISLYPQMMRNAGIPYTELITTLIETGRADYERRQSLFTGGH